MDRTEFISNEDPLLEFDLKNWNQLALALKTDWPKSIVLYRWVTTRLKWAVKEPGQNPFYIYCPGGNFRDGLVWFGYTGELLVYIGVYSFDNNLDKLKTALLNTKKIDWSKRPYCGIPVEMTEWFMTILGHLGYRVTENDQTHYFWMSKSKAKTLSFEYPDDIYIGPLLDKHLAAVNSQWPHKFEKSEDYLRSLVRLNFGHGVYSKSNDELLSWGIYYEYGDIGVTQTKEEHRRKGYASLILKSLAKKIAQEEDEDVCCYVLVHNDASKKLMKSNGFEYAGTCNWIQYE